MLCKHCHTDTVSWRGPPAAFTHTECSSCGGVNCQVPHPHNEGDQCPFCGLAVEYEESKNCSCHISPPCGSCTSVRLTCTECCEVFE